MSLDDLQAQLRGALDQQFAALKQHYEQAIADTRRQADAEAQRRLETARAEWESGMATIMEATRAETRQEVEAIARAQRQALELELQQQLEQTVQHSVNSVRRTTQLEIDALRRRVEEDVQAERQRGQAALDAERERAQQAQHAVEAERQRAQQAQQALEAERQRAQQAQQALEAEQQRAQQTQQVLAAEQQRAQQAQQALAAEQQRAQQAQQELEAERQRAQEIQQEVEADRQREQGAYEDERRQLQQTLEEEQARAAAELEAVKQLLEAEIASAQAEAALAREDAGNAAAAHAAAADAAAKASAAANVAAPAPGASAAFARLPEAVRGIDGAKSLSQTLEALLQYAGAIAGRAALFLVNGDRLKAWKAIAIPEIDVQTVESLINGRDLLARSIQAGQRTAATADLPAPPFARLPAGQPAMAMPLTINERAVAVIYADTGAGEGAEGWQEAVELVARHASTASALRAAARTLDVLRGDAGVPSAGNGNGEESARRYARLLVSEIKLYNEAAVRAGRQQRDLRQRLRSEIDRALQLYEERVPSAVGGREQYFHQELVQTLADGDPSLLGS